MVRWLRAAQGKRRREAVLQGIHQVHRRQLSRPNTRLARALALGATLAAIVAAGCGGDDDAGTPEPAVSPAGVPASFFGVVPQGTLAADDFERMAEGGIGSVRVLLPWSAVDPSPVPNEFDFSTIDPVIAEAARHGIEPLVYLAGMPEWAATIDGCPPDSCSGIPAPASEETLAAWRQLAAAASERYGPGGELWTEQPDLPEEPVRTWQIWNEQNSPTFYAPKPDVAGYARMLVAAESEIRKRDPDATVLLGGMHATPFGGEPPAITSDEFLRELYEIPGIERHFDGVAVHPYAAQLPKVTDQLELLRDEIERAGDDATLWVTETGWSSGTGENPLDRGPEGQAERLTEAYDLLTEHRREWDLQAVFWFSWRDRVADPVCDWCAYSGLFAESELEPKPAWDALMAFTGGS
jgi:polysaccharide biosynthesis protein PslG